jgi:LmbE family N-acetylglucosaminyl deacetylase
MRAKNKVLLGVFAHPDDEIIISGLLYRAKKQGIETHLVCATRGEAGRIKNPHVINNDNISIVRTKELENSCKVTEVSSLTFLDLPDNNARNWYKLKSEEKLFEVMLRIKPDIVITFDEDSGHPDHKKIHSITTSTFEKYKTMDLQKLYYFTRFPKSYINRFMKLIPISRKLKEKIISKATVQDNKVTAVMKLDKLEKKKKLLALGCHRSQFPDEKGKYYKMPYFIFRIFSKYECYFLKGSEENMKDGGYSIIDML